MGQSRLAVIDLLTGDPPLTDESGAIGVALNGEIYNYRALRRELLAGGHELRSAGDTEVIAHLAEDHPPEALCRRLDGMFAFALWDERDRRRLLGRDRLGKKPLYYWQGASGELAFASEIKAVLADPRVPRRLDEQALDAYLDFAYVPSPRTFFDGVRSVPPGHVLVATAGVPVELRPYWSPPHHHGDAPPGPMPEAAGEVRRVLRYAVEKRLVSDVPLGAFLSGGVDSSAVVALMAELVPRPFRDLAGVRPLVEAGVVLEPDGERLGTVGTEHTEFVVDPDKAEVIEGRPGARGRCRARPRRRAPGGGRRPRARDLEPPRPRGLPAARGLVGPWRGWGGAGPSSRPVPAGCASCASSPASTWGGRPRRDHPVWPGTAAELRRRGTAAREMVRDAFDQARLPRDIDGVYCGLLGRRPAAAGAPDPATMT